MKGDDKGSKGRVPVKEGLFTWPLPKNDIPPLIGSRCDACGKTFFPKRETCPDCQQKGDIKEALLSKIGRLYTYTIVRQAPPGFEAPYATALVDLPEGVRLFAQLTTADPAEIQLDGEVELTFGPISEDKAGNKVISYMFRPLNRDRKGG
jgi:uncharacterized OB-fold protein